MGFFSNLFNPSKAVGQASRKAIAETRATREANTALFAPYVMTGAQGLGRLGDVYGLNGVDAQERAAASFQTYPGYQFRFDQGIDAIDRSSAAKGMLRSGAQLKALNEYGQGVASQEYNRWLSGLGDMAKIGIAGASSNAAANTSANQSINKAYMDYGNAQAGQGIAQMGFLGNLVGSAFNAFKGPS